MNLILLFLLWTDPQLLTPAMLSHRVLVQDKSLLEELGNAVGDAIKAITGKPARAARVAPAAVVEQPAITPEKEKEEYQARLRAHGDALRQWLTDRCALNDEQRVKLQPILDKELEFERWSKDRPKNPNAQNMGNQVFGECFPIFFTRKNTGPATKFQDRVSKAVSTDFLSDEQRQRFKAAVDERAQFHNDAFRDYVISILDRELYLTTDQRAKLIADFQSNRSKFDSGLYSFQPQSYYLPYQSITTVVNAFNSVFGNEQRQRFGDLCSNAPNREQHLLFQSTDSTDDWYQQIENASVAQREQLLRSVAVRVAYYQSELKISQEQSNRLLIAGKGAAELALVDWKESTRGTVDQFADQPRMGNFAFAASKLSANDLERNAIWSETIGTILTNDLSAVAAARDKANKLARANALLAMLDQELWLQPEQRKPLLELVVNALPSQRLGASMDSQEYIREIALLAQPLFKIPDSKLKTILSESQLEAWNQMKSYFRMQPGGKYLMVPMRLHGGNFSVQLYD